MPDVLRDNGFSVQPPRTGTRTLLDTFDGRLDAAGTRLELRRGAQVELVLRDRNGAAHLTVPTPPRFADELPHGPFRSRLAAVTDVRALLPVVAVTVRETEAIRRNGTGKVVARVTAMDEAQLESGRPLGLWTAEVHELAGYPEPATQARELLAEAGLTPTSDDLLVQAATITGVDVGGFRASPTIPLEPAMPALAGFRDVLSNLAHSIQANWQGTIDDVDPEFLHDLRVAVRRTRSVLGHGRGVLPADVRAEFRDRFSSLGAITGPARDLDVNVIEWERYIAPLPPQARAALAPVLEQLRTQRRAAHHTLAEELRSSASSAVLPDWRAWLDTAAPPDDDSPLGPVVARRINKAQQRLVAQGRGIGEDSPDEELHELRKDAKKLRYLLECFGGLYDPRPRKAFVKRLKALQENLGELQDAAVHVEWLAQVAATLPHASAPVETFVAIGRLTEHMEQHRYAARRAFATRFAAYDEGATRRALAELLAT